MSTNGHTPADAVDPLRLLRAVDRLEAVAEHLHQSGGAITDGQPILAASGVIARMALDRVVCDRFSGHVMSLPPDILAEVARQLARCDQPIARTYEWLIRQGYDIAETNFYRFVETFDAARLRVLREIAGIEDPPMPTRPADPTVPATLDACIVAAVDRLERSGRYKLCRLVPRETRLALARYCVAQDTEGNSHKAYTWLDREHAAPIHNSTIAHWHRAFWKAVQGVRKSSRKSPPRGNTA